MLERIKEALTAITGYPKPEDPPVITELRRRQSRGVIDLLSKRG
jgi:hypothetical protein